MKHDIVPCFWIGDLEQALELQYGRPFMEEVEEEFHGLRNMMFYENYMNDVCCKYYIDELEEYEGKEYQNECHIHLENCVKIFLRDLFPGHDYVVVDVMW